MFDFYQKFDKNDSDEQKYKYLYIYRLYILHVDILIITMLNFTYKQLINENK